MPSQRSLDDSRGKPTSEREVADVSPDASLAASGQVVVPFPVPLQPLSSVRSTLLLASVSALRAGGHFAAYAAVLPSEHRAAVLESIAACWVPSAAALAHYRACDRLGLTSLEQMALGRQTGDGLRRHLTRAVGTLAREVVSPWLVFQHFNRFWSRTFNGGGVSVVKLGPKDAEIIYARCTLLQSPYFRSALRGVALGLLEVVSRRVFMSETSFSANRHEARYRVAWA
jgi:hypothetical protein